jgi:transcription elongation factor Elf1
LSCKVCGQRFQTGINCGWTFDQLGVEEYRLTSDPFTDLSAAVDVYSDWVDACDAVAKSKANTYDASNSQAVYSRGSPADADLEGPDL